MRARALTGALLACLLLSLSACSGHHESLTPTSADRSADSSASGSTGSSPSASGEGSATTSGTSYAVDDPGRFKPPMRTADVLVTSSKTIPDSVRERVDHVDGVRASLPMSFAALSSNGRTLTLAAADPAGFRNFTPYASASADEVWKRVAGGEVAVDPSLPRGLEEPKGFLRLGTSKDAPPVHIGAYAPLVKQISAFVNDKRAEQLGMPKRNALLISTKLTPSKVIGKLKKVLGPDITMQTLALEFNVGVSQTAVLSGTSVSQAVGTFNYTPHADGTVTPDPRWVRTYIRRETMPIIGPVTGNKGMLPQLRAALTQILRTPGLASAIHPSEYGGCYVPRFIANDPAKGLSLHSWGMAVDLNVPENQRGTVGKMNRQVVAIFKKWGFAWGGDWHYTDPMHFEMDKVVKIAG